MGWLGLSAAAIAAVWLSATAAPWPWRLTVFVPAFVGLLGLLQARARTCVALAVCGLRNMDGRNERIGSGEELRAIQRQAGGATVQAAAVAAALTALALVV